MAQLSYVLFVLFCSISIWTRMTVESASVPKLVDEWIIQKTLTFQPRSDSELKQFRVLTYLLKSVVDKRIKQIEEITTVSEELDNKMKEELSQLRQYSSMLGNIRAKLGPVTWKDGGSNVNGRDMSRTVVDGINHPLWVLHQLRRAEQQRRRNDVHSWNIKDG